MHIVSEPPHRQERVDECAPQYAAPGGHEGTWVCDSVCQCRPVGRSKVCGTAGDEIGFLSPCDGLQGKTQMEG